MWAKLFKFLFKKDLKNLTSLFFFIKLHFVMVNHIKSEHNTLKYVILISQLQSSSFLQATAFSKFEQGDDAFYCIHIHHTIQSQVWRNLMLFNDLYRCSLHTNPTVELHDRLKPAVGTYLISLRRLYFHMNHTAGPHPLPHPHPPKLFARRWDVQCGQSVPAAALLMSLSDPGDVPHA